MSLEFIETTTRDLRYNIQGSIITQDEIVFYVSEFNEFQKEIPNSVDGLNIEIVLDT